MGPFTTLSCHHCGAGCVGGWSIQAPSPASLRPARHWRAKARAGPARRGPFLTQGLALLPAGPFVDPPADLFWFQARRCQRLRCQRHAKGGFHAQASCPCSVADLRHGRRGPAAAGHQPAASEGGDQPSAGARHDSRHAQADRPQIQDAQNETIGQITSIYIGPDGHVDSVVVGVGGFLGLGEREVKIAWSDLHVENYGEKVMVNMTKDELKAKPEYKYGDTSWRGQVFSDKGPWPAADPNRSASAADRMPNNGVVIGGKPASDRNMAAATTSTGDFNAAGEMSGAAIIGATVQNENHETVGKVQDIYVDSGGAIKKVVVSVGGFLGMGAKDVVVNWSDIRFSRDDKSVVLTTTWTKEISLKEMPDYKYERRVPATKSGG